MSDAPGENTQQPQTSVDELNDEGLGATTGAKNTFEPEEADPQVDPQADPEADMGAGSNLSDDEATPSEQPQ